MRALLGDQRDQLADLRVVDRVLQRVGRGRVGLAHVESQVEHQALADLALGLAHAVVGIQRQAGDLDRDRLGAALGVIVAILVLVELVIAVLLVLVIPIARALG